MKKHVIQHLLTIAFLHFYSVLFSQNSYFIKDSTITYGSDIIEYNSTEINCKFCEVRDNNTTIKYTPYQVSEYRFDNGQTFVAKKIQLYDSLQMVFLERLVSGNFTLYYYKERNYSTFFISKDSASVVELPQLVENNTFGFRNQLKIFTSECPELENNAKLVRYNREAFKEFFKRLNNCDSKYFPFFRYGFTTGIQLIQLNLSDDFNLDKLIPMNYNYKAGFTAGFFVDIPLLPTSFSIYSSASLSKHGFSYYKYIEGYDVDFVMNITTLKVPLMLKYSFTAGNYRSYIETGLSTIYHIRNKAEIIETMNTGSLINTGTQNRITALDNLQYGFEIETGIEKRLNYRQYLSLGLRYSAVPGNSKSFGSSNISLITSINF